MSDLRLLTQLKLAMAIIFITKQIKLMFLLANLKLGLTLNGKVMWLLHHQFIRQEQSIQKSMTEILSFSLMI